MLHALVLLAFSGPANGVPLVPPPIAEVSDSSGPVKLTLRVYKTRIKLNEPLWFQIEVKSVGKGHILVRDAAFEDASELCSPGRFGVRLEIRGPDGRQPYRFTPAVKHEIDAAPIPDTAEYRSLRKQMEKDGVPEREIVRRLTDRQIEEFRRTQPGPKVWKLLAGESVVTPSFVWKGWPTVRGVKTETAEPLGQYAELPCYRWTIGRHKIRATYDNRSDGSRYPWRVMTETRWVEFEVEK